MMSAETAWNMARAVVAATGFFLLLASPVFAQDSSDTVLPVTREEVLRYFRTDALHRGATTEFRAIREIVPTDDTRRLGQRVLALESQPLPPQIEVLRIGDEDLVGGVLRCGAVIVAEFDPTTNQTEKLLLVTKNEGGFLSEPIYLGGPLQIEETTQIVNLLREFAMELYSEPAGGMEQFWNAHFPRHLPPRSEEWGSHLGIPIGLMQLGTHEEIRELLVLRSSFLTKHARLALSSEDYSIGPTVADNRSQQEVLLATVKYLEEWGEFSDAAERIIGLESLSSKLDLTERIHFFRSLNAHLDHHLARKVDTAIFSANRLLSTIPTAIGSNNASGKRLYSARLPGYWFAVWERNGDTFTLVDFGESN